MTAEDDEEHLKEIASMKAWWDSLANKGLASGHDHWVTEASRRKADIDEDDAESKKEQAVTDRIFASGDKDGMLARLQELKSNLGQKNVQDTHMGKGFPQQETEKFLKQSFRPIPFFSNGVATSLMEWCPPAET